MALGSFQLQPANQAPPPVHGLAQLLNMMGMGSIPPNRFTPQEGMGMENMPSPLMRHDMGNMPSPMGQNLMHYGPMQQMQQQGSPLPAILGGMQQHQQSSPLQAIMGGMQREGGQQIPPIVQEAIFRRLTRGQ